MDVSDSIAVRRPKRWDEPFDPSMTDADVAWLRSREPFASLAPSAFPKSSPLEGILRNDCRLHRCEPGTVIVREGDYGNSAFLVLAGSVRVLVESLAPEAVGRAATSRAGWWDALRRYWRIGNVRERRHPHEVTPAAGGGSSPLREVDDRPTVFLQDFDAVLSTHESVQLGPGELFGEVAAMYRTPRTATVVADNEATLLEIRWQGLRVLRRDRDFAAQLEQHYRAHWLPVHLREIPLFRYLPETNLQRVASVTQLRSFGKMQWDTDYRQTRAVSPAEQIESEPVVAHEGSQPTELLVVRSGFGRVSRQYGAGHLTTAYLGKGHLFGLEEVTHNTLRGEGNPPMGYQHSLRAVGCLDTLNIPVEAFASDVLPHVRRSELPASVSRLLAAARSGDRGDRRKTNRRETRGRPAASPDRETPSGTSFAQTDLLEFIVQHRLNNGRQAMVIDLDRCTRCDDCVKACASVHDGNPRFSRQGVAHGRLQFAQACMHCSDPVCMIGCPTGAIARDENTGVVEIHEAICVGCGTCANACPYDNIQMSEIFNHDGRPYTDARSGKPITKATKCDLCNSSPSGPACAAACPHDALVRIDLSESEPLSYWLQRRS